ncbi:M90 metallopeptidase family protein [Labilibaculum euxinus]
MKKILILIAVLMPLYVASAKNEKTDQSGQKIFTIASPPSDFKFDSFYKKYVNVNGIHIMSSNKVPDSAFYVACNIVDFMTKSLPGEVLSQMVKENARLAIMARYEGTTDIPEHAHLAQDTTLNWDLRARGLGGDMELPLTSCAEENLLAYQIDKYHAEDILVHEFAHAIHLIGIAPIDSTFNNLLQEKLDNAIAKGKYKKMYAATNIYEYWAEGVQNWFNVNAEVKVPDGKHNWVNTREDMKKYDPDLYEIVARYFPEFEKSPSRHSTANLYRE